MEKAVPDKNDIISRSWYYFRIGWSTYFAFIFAAINTLTVTFYLAIQNYPSLKAIFPSFEIYVLLIVSIGFPILIAIGYVHYKRSKARKAEVDIDYETDPYKMRTITNSDMILNLYLKLGTVISYRYKKHLTDERFDNFSKLLNEIQLYTESRKFRKNHDLEFFQNIDSQLIHKNLNDKIDG